MSPIDTKRRDHSRRLERGPLRRPLPDKAAGRVRNARQALQKHKGKQASPFRRYCDQFRWDGHGLRPANCIANFCQTL